MNTRYLRIEQNVLPYTSDFFYLPEEEARRLYYNGHLDYHPDEQTFKTNDSAEPFRSRNFIRLPAKLRGDFEILSKYPEDAPPKSSLDCGCPSIRVCRDKGNCLTFALYEMNREFDEADAEADELNQFLSTIGDGK